MPVICDHFQAILFLRYNNEGNLSQVGGGEKNWMLTWISFVSCVIGAVQDETFHAQNAEEEEDDCLDYRPVSNLSFVSELIAGCLP